MFGKDKYIWKKVARRDASWSVDHCLMRAAFYEKHLDEQGYFNFNAYFRGKRNWKSYLSNYCSAKYAEKQYQVNLKLSKQKFIETDCWNYEQKASAWKERKSWKRNSKKSHQWE